MGNNYFEDRNNAMTLKLRKIRNELPTFCGEFFIGIENRTTVLTRLNYAYDLRIFFDYLLSFTREFKKFTLDTLAISDLNEVTQTHIETYLEYLNYYKYGSKTYSNDENAKSRKLSSLRSFFKYFFNKNCLKSNVASKVAMPKLHDKAIIRLEVDEVAKLLDEVEDGGKLSPKQQAFHKHTKMRDLALITLLLGTGIRISECVGLNIEDLDFKTNGFSVTRKGGNRTILYFPEEVADTLRKYLEERFLIEADTTALFLSLQKKRITARAVELLVKKYSQIIVPLKKITPHKLRSTYGTTLYSETQDIYIVAEVLGHKDINTTKKHYAAISDDIKRNAAKHITLRDKN